MEDFERAFRKFLAVLTDRVTILILVADMGVLLKLNIFGMIVLSIFFDFMIYVVLRTFLGRTPGDIMFGVVIKVGSPKFFRLLLRWLLGFLSPFTGFLLHVPAIRWRSFCDTIVGINPEIV